MIAEIPAIVRADLLDRCRTEPPLGVPPVATVNRTRNPYFGFATCVRFSSACPALRTLVSRSNLSPAPSAVAAAALSTERCLDS